MQQVYDFLCNKLRFTREDMRLWKISSKDEVSWLTLSSCLTLLFLHIKTDVFANSVYF